ncbi:MAG: TetR/AcrR family transcriptional regulator C-terminal domain-containing protein [Succinivibrio sp.]|nr:TetR/AcrR family transcriptional regulator C-terminal domain-containing protein [Succinivibrio sp.]
MKRKTAREILIESFLELAEQNNVDKISVKDITDNCGYSTATFYRQFKDKYDLIAYEYALKVESLFQKIDQHDFSFEDMITEGICLYESRKKYLVNLLLHTTGLDSFRHHMVEINYRIMSQTIIKNKPDKKLDETEEMYLRFYCEGCTCVFCYWLLGRYLADKEKLIKILVNSLPPSLHPYFHFEKSVK